MMKFLIKITFYLFCVCFITSCTSGLSKWKPSSLADKWTPGFVERYENQQNLEKLQEGMNKKEVLEIMGVPLVNQKYHKPNVWFYLTYWDWGDVARTKSECTPLVFDKNGNLKGWGRNYYRQHRQKKWEFGSSFDN